MRGLLTHLPAERAWLFALLGGALHPGLRGGADLHNKFSCRHFPGWEFQLRKLGFGTIASHMRRSVKSELGIAKKRRLTAANTVDFGSEQEFSMSTVALIALLAWVAAERPAQSAARRHETERSALLLRIMLDSFLGGRSFQLPLATGGYIDIVDRLVSTSSIAAACPALGRTAAVLDDRAPMSELLVLLVAMRRRPSRHTPKTVEAAGITVVALVSSLALRFELCMAKNLSDESLLSLPVLRLRSARPRRISTARTRVLISAVAATKGIRRPEAYLAAQQIKAKSCGSAKGLAPKSGGGFVKDERLNYFLASWELFGKTSHVALVTDAARVAGDDRLVTVCVSTEEEKCCWAPPQASLSANNFRIVSEQPALNVTKQAHLYVTKQARQARPQGFSFQGGRGSPERHF